MVQIPSAPPTSHALTGDLASPLDPAKAPAAQAIRTTADADSQTIVDGERKTVTALPRGSSTPTRLNAAGPEGARGLFHRLLASFLSRCLIETPDADPTP